MNLRLFMPCAYLTLLAFASGAAMAQTPPAAPSVSFDVNALLPESAVRTLTKTLGLLTNHRPYQGAVGMGPSSFHMGAEATLVHLPEGFTSALSDMGISGGSAAAVAALPMLKIHLDKGLSNQADFSFSGLYFPGSYILGGALKFMLHDPGEGLAWAFRIGYSATQLDFSKLGFGTLPITVPGADVQSSIHLKTKSITPQLVGSQRLDFAEPYIGVGLQWVEGALEVPVTVTAFGQQASDVLTTPSYRSTSGMAFTGVAFHITEINIRLAIEGSYSSIGAHYFGLVAGLAF